MNLPMAVFLIFNGLSFLHCVCVDKIEFLSAIYEDGSYSTVALSGFWTLGKLTTFYIIVLRHEKIARMLESFEKYEEAYPMMKARFGPRHKVDYAFFFIFISTIVTVTMEIWSICNLGLGEALLMGSHTLAKFLFLWTDGNLSEKALLLKYEYGSELTLGTVVMGGIFIASEIISILDTGMVLGLMMFLAVLLHAYFAELIKDIREFRGDRKTEKVEEWKRRPVKCAQFWRRFKMLQDVFESVNDALDELFKIILAVDMICIGAFLSISFLGTPTTYYSIYIIHLVFVLVWFIYAAKIAELNEELLEWIRNCGVDIGRVRVGRVAVNPRVVLEELEKKPIGFEPGRHIILRTPQYLVVRMLNRVWVAIFGILKGK